MTVVGMDAGVGRGLAAREGPVMMRGGIRATGAAGGMRGGVRGGRGAGRGVAGGH